MTEKASKALEKEQEASAKAKEKADKIVAEAAKKAGGVTESAEKKAAGVTEVRRARGAPLPLMFMSHRRVHAWRDHPCGVRVRPSLRRARATILAPCAWRDACAAAASCVHRARPRRRRASPRAPRARRRG